MASRTRRALSPAHRQAATAAAPVAGSSRAYSFGANYANGPISVGAAYTDIRFPSQAVPAFSTTLANVTTGNVRDLRTYGVGGRYTIGAATLWALYTNTRFETLTGAATTFTAYDAGAKYAFTAALTVGAGYTYMHLSNANTGHWNQGDLSVDYALSKRTDVYGWVSTRSLRATTRQRAMCRRRLAPARASSARRVRGRTTSWRSAWAFATASDAGVPRDSEVR